MYHESSILLGDSHGIFYDFTSGWKKSITRQLYCEKEKDNAPSYFSREANVVSMKLCVNKCIERTYNKNDHRNYSSKNWRRQVKKAMFEIHFFPVIFWQVGFRPESNKFKYKENENDKGFGALIWIVFCGFFLWMENRQKHLKFPFRGVPIFLWLLMF